MGIVNVTPDSFSDGGRHFDPGSAVAHGERLAGEGADVLDVGGASSRPGAEEVPVEEEARRVLPVIRGLARGAVPISVDTRHASVAAAALEAGATWVNDISAGADPAMFPLVAASGATLVLMHMRGTPATMQGMTTYADVCTEVWAELWRRREVARGAGVRSDRIVLDPGIGFAKTTEQNLALLRDLPRRSGVRLLVGASRKRFIGELTGQAIAGDRLEGSLAVALHAAAAGVTFLRVHDVGATARALAVWSALRDSPVPA